MSALPFPCSGLFICLKYWYNACSRLLLYTNAAAHACRLVRHTQALSYYLAGSGNQDVSVAGWPATPVCSGSTDRQDFDLRVISGHGQVQ
eukprot:2052964-Pyramimonas_sp.AAC.1